VSPKLAVLPEAPSARYPDRLGTWCNKCHRPVTSTVFSTRRRSFFTMRGRSCDSCEHEFATAEITITKEELEFFAAVSIELDAIRDPKVVERCALVLQANTAGFHIKALRQLAREDQDVGAMIRRLEFGQRL
jgi:hypothetical protein